MKRETSELVQRIQTTMVESARATFEEPQLDSLRCLIRLTAEFYDYLQIGSPFPREYSENYSRLVGIPWPRHEMELKYAVESTFSGIHSFCDVDQSYKVLTGATKSRIKWDTVSLKSLKGIFVSTFKEYSEEKDFETKCRLLLDMYKLQIVFAGMHYD